MFIVNPYKLKLAFINGNRNGGIMFSQIECDTGLLTRTRYNVNGNGERHLRSCWINAFLNRARSHLGVREQAAGVLGITFAACFHVIRGFRSHLRFAVTARRLSGVYRFQIGDGDCAPNAPLNTNSMLSLTRSMPAVRQRRGTRKPYTGRAGNGV